MFQLFKLYVDLEEVEMKFQINLFLKKKLKWIPYNQFKDVEFLAKGGFGTIHKAIWLSKDRNIEIALKCLDNLNENNLNENLNEFLNEV